MRTLFFKQYLRNVRTVGAVAPSSHFLARKMLDEVDFTRAKVIVEYGAGTGVFTAEAAKRMQPGTKILVIELNQAFYNELREKFADNSNIEILNDSAASVSRLLQERNLPAPDYIISGLPFAALPANISHSILATTAKLLGDNGVFITFQYTLLKKTLFANHFSHTKITREVRNIPPAFVFRCDNSI